MSFLKNLVKKAGSVVKGAAKGIAKAKNVLLPIAGVAVGLAAPALGGVIGRLTSKVQSTAGSIKEKGFLGIGDGKPGIFGIGTGKGVLKAIGQASAGSSLATGSTDLVDMLDGAPAPEPESTGVPGWLKVGGVALAAKLLLGI